MLASAECGTRNAEYTNVSRKLRLLIPSWLGVSFYGFRASFDILTTASCSQEDSEFQQADIPAHSEIFRVPQSALRNPRAFSAELER
jgi:hypothetical protein